MAQHKTLYKENQMKITLEETLPQLCQKCFKVHVGSQSLYSPEAIQEVYEANEKKRMVYGKLNDNEANVRYNTLCLVKQLLEKLEEYQKKGLNCES